MEATAMIPETITLASLDEQSRERLIRAAEDSVRGELRRVNALLCEAVAENERLTRIEVGKATCCHDNEQRAVRAEAALTEALLKLNTAEHARDEYRIRAQAAERSVGMPATGRCAQCATVAPMLATTDGDMCGACWTQRGAAAE